jgi:predicted metal-dependent enzyme (double-stranded beta helix superfamily)
MWVFIGLYGGREDNIFWRRIPGDPGGRACARALCASAAKPLGRNIIHSVTNPIPRLTGAILVYRGDFLRGGAQRMGFGIAAGRALRR